MQKRTALRLLAIATICVGAVCVWRLNIPKRNGAGSQTAPQTNALTTDTLSATPAPLVATTTLAQLVTAIAGSLKNNSNAVASAKNLGELRSRLDSLGTNGASAAIRQWLDSGEDAATRLNFKLSRDGNLKDAPTLRTFLLDYLAQIDPQAAAAYAENIFRSSNSADEWALALRAYALGNSTDERRAYLQQRVREMLRNEEWSRNPSVGFLEAFDVIVHTRDKELTPELGKMIQQKDNRALAHAAYLTLDRLVQAAPADVLGQLQSQPELMEGHERTRADFFARADVRDSAQKTVLENYLLDAKRSGPELQQFAGIFPNVNYMVSYNLLTQTVTPTGAELASRDREALNTIQQWLDDPRFVKLKPQLQAIRTRLEQFVNQAGENQP